MSYPLTARCDCALSANGKMRTVSPTVDKVAPCDTWWHLAEKMRNNKQGVPVRIASREKTQIFLVRAVGHDGRRVRASAERQPGQCRGGIRCSNSRRGERRASETRSSRLERVRYVQRRVWRKQRRGATRRGVGSGRRLGAVFLAERVLTTDRDFVDLGVPDSRLEEPRI